MTGSEIDRQPLPEFVTVSGSALAPLLELDNPAADLPLGGGEDGVNGL